MQQFTCVQVLFFFCVTIINGLRLLDSSPNLSSSLSSGNEKAVVFLLDLTKDKNHNSEIEDLLTQLKDNEEDDESSDEVGDEETYLLYNVLRSTPEDSLDPVVAESISNTKEVLRQALRRRCNKIDTCVKKCPSKKPKCPKTCKKAYDSYNVCDDKPKTCNKCGRTMPPKWLLLKK